MSKPIIAWSHSRIDAFLTCPLKLYEVGIAKNFTDDFGEAADWGKKVHKALENRLKLGAKLPSNMVQYEKVCTNVDEIARRTGMEIHTELQLAVDQKLKPCSWRDWSSCWVRCALDLLLVHPTNPKAVAIDWKTGKVKHDDRQLALQAAMVFRHYPHVNEVLSSYCWLKEEGRMVSITFNRDKEKLLWQQYLPVARELTDAVTFGKWPAKPSGLCREYCPVNSCKHNGAYNK